MHRRMKQRRITSTDPTTWAVDPTQLMGDITRPGGGARNGASGLIPTASIAASVSAQGETAADDTAPTPASSERQESGSGARDTSANTKRIAGAVSCEHCGDEFTPKRAWGRFCSSYCRRSAWLERNPEKAAELAERDRQRLREHVIGCGGEWRERAW